MSRTYRLGKPHNDRHQYHRDRAIWLANQGCSYSGEWRPYWVDTYLVAKTYEEYVKLSIAEHHRDGGRRNVPRDVRKEDLDKQKMRHKKAISRGKRTGDWEAVVLEKLRKDASWNYW